MKINNFYNPYRENNEAVFRIIIVAVILCIASWFMSCDDFTEVDMPVTELNSNAVFEQKSTAYAAMTDIYAKMRENGVLTGKGTGISRDMGLYADELDWYGSQTLVTQSFYNNGLLPTALPLGNWWNHSYNQIYSANAVLEGVAASKTLAPEDKDRLSGEALFVRGLLHFYLLQLFGDVPYITTTDYTKNVNVARLSETEVYDKILADLNAADGLLSEEYLSTDRTRPNNFAVKAMLARVQLYNGDWAEAANSASAVLNATGTYTLPADLSNFFVKESTGTIWQFSPRTATRNTDEGSTFIFNSAPPAAAALTNVLMGSFEPGDQRRAKWTRARSAGGTTWYHAYKYKKTTTSTPQLEYSIVLRLSEMYLIRAEARARQGELIGAKEDIDVLRNKAGLLGTTAITQAEILDAVLQERRVEFFTEYGHRFMDLKRMGKLDTFLSSLKASWQATDRLLPLPQKEINLNPNIGPQNPGY